MNFSVSLTLPVLLLFYIQDSLNKKISSLAVAERVEKTIAILNEGHTKLRDIGYHYSATTSLNYLEGIAHIRFGLSVVAEVLYQQQHDIHIVNLMHTAKDVCTDPAINYTDESGNVDVTGPVLYLLKQLFRRFGRTCLLNAVKDHRWIIPENLRTEDEVCNE